MSESQSKIVEFERQVMTRKRLLALQDRLALAIPISCAVAAGFILLARMREGGSVPWAILSVILITELGAFIYNWYKTRATKQEAAFLIDEKLNLEDRVSTAHEIISKGGARREVETALIDDAAGRVSDQSARAIVPYQLRNWYAFTLIAVAALAAALMIPERSLPGGEAIAEARENIQSAGEQLEQSGEEVAQAAPIESETAKLAKEQAELGRIFRRSPASRAEALKKLSALEDRIRQRHGELASTRADEIVNIAQQRLRSTLHRATKQQGKEAEAGAGEETNGEEKSDEAQESNDDAVSANANAAQPRHPGRNKKQAAPKRTENQIAKLDRKASNANKNSESDLIAAAKQTEANAKTPGQKDSDSIKKQSAKNDEQQANTQQATQGQEGQPTPQKGLQKPVSGQGASEKNRTTNPESAGQQPSTANNANQKPDSRASEDQKDQTGEQNSDAGQKPDASKDSSNLLTGLVAEQAAKALPKMSEELLKKAAQLRAGQMTPDDIKGLQQAAETLARDLSKIAQSKELQQAAEQLAKQITPEQLEQFARALGNQEQLKQELEAAARLMMQNQQAKAMVAGLAQKFAKIGEEFGGHEGKNRPKGNAETGERSGNEAPERGKGNADDARGLTRMSGGLTERADGGMARTGQGRETKLSGNVQRGSGGDYLYLKSQAAAGAARVPYSSAYPQYRREAERSVERSQVPPRMRSVVRSYFDRINPDAAKKP